MIEVRNLSKRYGEKLAVDGLGLCGAARGRDRFLRPKRSGQVDDDAVDRSAGVSRAGAASPGQREGVPDRRSRQWAELGLLLEARARHRRPLRPQPPGWRWPRTNGIQLAARG